MHLNIKNDDAHRMARELSRLTGESMTEVVIRALEQRLGNERRRRMERRDGLESRIEAIVARVQARPVLDERSGDEILYDRDGLPK